MFYLAPSELWYFAIARLTVRFDDNKEEFGTGFFFDDGESYFVATARHVVDCRYRPPGKKRDATCAKIRLDFLLFGSDSATIAAGNIELRFPVYTVDPEDNDCVVFAIPHADLPVKTPNGELKPYAFSKEFLADEAHLGSRHAGEPILFIGYPRNSPVKEYHAFNKSFTHVYPLLRQGVLAFPTTTPVRVDGFLGNNYGVIDSFAQNGFSGAPVISLQKGLSDGSWNPVEYYRPPRVLGIVCGHYRSIDERADGVHSGLSYFVRSNSIHKCLALLKNS